MITVTIISKEGRILAKEVNSMKKPIFWIDSPNHYKKQDCYKDCKYLQDAIAKYQSAEDKLRTFEIEEEICICGNTAMRLRCNV